MPVQAVEQRSQENRAVFATFAVAATLVLFAFVFGSADVEESANASYSAGANHATMVGMGRDSGTHSVLGVPAFDTLQGTGDRLPYQASWGQSITWPLRFIVDWQWYHLWRSLFFAIPSLWLCLRTLQSWRPSASWLSMTLFGLLISASFGLYLRQNEWSDHYVQTMGVCALSMFLMHRQFHDLEENHVSEPHVLSVICLAISLNGVVTGHPGFWPIAIAVWAALGVCFVTSKVFLSQISAWLRMHRVALSVILISTLVTFVAIFQDLISELEGQPFSAGRLERSQGLFSEFAFAGLYGLSPGGSLPSTAKSFIASLLGTTVMPVFILLDGWLPQFLRVSDFREMPRVEFSGALVIVAVVLGWRRIGKVPLRSLTTRILAAQLLIWLFVVASAADLVPSAVATSGAWMTLAVVLAFNVFLAWLLLDSSWRQSLATRLVARANILLIGAWCMLQFGFLSLGSGFQIPERYSSWFNDANRVAQSQTLKDTHDTSARLLIVRSPSFYDFLPFVATGQPVVAPADPKMRASSQLQSSFGLNYSINIPLFTDLEDAQVDRTLNFLQVRRVLVASLSTSELPDVVTRLGSTLSLTGHLDLTRTSYRVFERNRFSAFTIDQRSLRDADTCPLLQQDCPILASSRISDATSRHPLTTCARKCLWRFESPEVTSGEALLLPVTFDEALKVRDEAGIHLKTSDAGGFLAVHGEREMPATTLTIELDPDFRMIARVIASYVNLLMVLFLAAFMVYPKIVMPLRAKKQAQSLGQA
jgi:hypothetical protein